MASSNAFMDELYSVEYAQFALRVGDHCHTRSISSKAWHHSALNCVNQRWMAQKLDLIAAFVVLAVTIYVRSALARLLSGHISHKECWSDSGIVSV